MYPFVVFGHGLGVASKVHAARKGALFEPPLPDNGQCASDLATHSSPIRTSCSSTGVTTTSKQPSNPPSA